MCLRVRSIPKRLIAAGGVLAALGVLVWLHLSSQPLAFNEAGWRNGSPRTRWRMAQDPQLARRVTGLPESELVKRLGPPDFVSTKPSQPNVRAYNYRLDEPWDPLACHLFVRLDDGVVTLIEITEN